MISVSSRRMRVPVFLCPPRLHWGVMYFFFKDLFIIYYLFIYGYVRS